MVNKKEAREMIIAFHKGVLENAEKEKLATERFVGHLNVNKNIGLLNSLTIKNTLRLQSDLVNTYKTVISELSNEE